MTAVYTLDMPIANAPHDDKIPENHPIFPSLKTAQFTKLEVHYQYTDGEGDKQWSELEDVPTHSTWKDIERKGGGGFVKVTGRGKGNVIIAHTKKRLHAKPKFLNEIRDAEETEDEIADEPEDESLKLVHKTIEQQTTMLPAAFSAITTALVSASEAHGERMAAMAQNQANLVNANAAALEALRVSYRAEIDGYRLEIARLQARIVDLEKKNDELTKDNVGYLRTINTSGSPDGWVRTVKEIAPELPKLRGFFKEMKSAITDGANNGAAKQITAGNPVPDTRSQFGGD